MMTAWFWKSQGPPTIAVSQSPRQLNCTVNKFESIGRQRTLVGFHADRISTYRAEGLKPLFVCTLMIASHFACTSGRSDSSPHTNPSPSSSWRASQLNRLLISSLLAPPYVVLLLSLLNRSLTSSPLAPPCVVLLPSAAITGTWSRTDAPFA